MTAGPLSHKEAVLVARCTVERVERIRQYTRGLGVPEIGDELAELHRHTLAIYEALLTAPPPETDTPT